MIVAVVAALGLALALGLTVGLPIGGAELTKGEVAIGLSG